MFKRHIQVKLVKTSGGLTQTNQDVSLEGKVAIIGHYATGVIQTVGKALIAYVVVDTLRQVLVAKALK
jgi:hypothetical protein